MANKLREMRHKRMLTTKELARRSGVSRATIWKVETKPNYSTGEKVMVALAKALDMPVTDIFFTDHG